jgi:glycosyltransferase involved in cell wall biosynthesis
VSVITSNSIEGRDFLARTYGVDPSRIRVYNNGTPLIEAVDAGGFRSRLNLGSRPIVSMVANVTPYKDHPTLIDAWRMVRNRFPGPHGPVLLIAGSVADKEKVSSLMTQAFHAGLSADDLMFLGPVDDVPELMSASDLVVHSSVTEGCPNSVCEAMALGRAVVATDISGCRQALGDDSAEFLSPPRDAADFAARIIRMLEDPALRARTGEKNRQRIRTEFSIDGMNRFFQARIEEGLGVALG